MILMVDGVFTQSKVRSKIVLGAGALPAPFLVGVHWDIARGGSVEIFEICRAACRVCVRSLSHYWTRTN